jgi:hypothetical protein
MRRMLGCSAMAVATALAGPAASAGFDGADVLICAPVEILACEPDIKCEHETAEIIDLPQFLRVSVQDKTIVGSRPSGTAVNAKIGYVAHSERKMFLQGVERSFAWSMGIDEESGRMTMTIGDDRSGYVVFGACTPR